MGIVDSFRAGVSRRRMACRVVAGRGGRGVAMDSYTGVRPVVIRSMTLDCDGKAEQLSQAT